MQEIPAETLKAIIALREENGLEATEAAVTKDLTKAKWALVEKPRYRRAGRSPLFISGKYLTATGKDPITGEVDAPPTGASVPQGKAAAASKAKIDELVFYRVLHGKGYAVKHTTNSLTGATEKELPPALAKLDLQFTATPANAAGIHVIQTTPQIQVAMPLETFLDLAGIKP